MAERNRRGDDAAAENLDDEGAFDEGAFDESDLDDVEEPAARPSRSRAAGTATKARPRAEGAKPARKEAGRGGPIARIGRFVREVVAELRKVIWPTRKELLTYTTVVVVFVAVMMALVAGLDLGFAKVVLWVFGGGGKQ